MPFVPGKGQEAQGSPPGRIRPSRQAGGRPAGLFSKPARPCRHPACRPAGFFCALRQGWERVMDMWGAAQPRAVR